MTDEENKAQLIDPDKFNGIVLDHNRVACGLHREPFRGEWPKGFALFTVRAFQAVMGLDGLFEEARRLHHLLPDAEVDVKRLELVFDVRPICCRLSREALYQLYIESGVGVTGRCRACGRKALGTPYITQTQAFSHLCFTCVCSASTSPQGVH